MRTELPIESAREAPGCSPRGETEAIAAFDQVSIISHDNMCIYTKISSQDHVAAAKQPGPDASVVKQRTASYRNPFTPRAYGTLIAVSGSTFRCRTHHGLKIDGPDGRVSAGTMT